MSPSPFSGRGPVRVGAERMSLLDTFCLRLERLGVPPEDIAEVRARWDDVDSPDDEAERDRIASLSDDRLADEIAKVEAEWAMVQPTAESGGEDVVAGGAVDAPSPSATINEILVWVGSDTGRARVALEAENARPAPRVTLVDALERLGGPAG